MGLTPNSAYLQLWHLDWWQLHEQSGANQILVLGRPNLNMLVVFPFLPVLTSCVTLGKSVNLSEPPVPLL